MLDQPRIAVQEAPVAAIVSRLLHPALMLIVAAIATLLTAPESIAALLIVLGAIVVVVVLVMGVFPQIGKRGGWPEERRKNTSFLVSAAVVGLAMIIISTLGAPAELLCIGIAFFVGAALTSAARLKFRVSVHTAVFSGTILGMATAFSPWWFVGIIALPALVWSRNELGRQSVMQSLAGAAIGIVAWGAYLLSRSMLGISV